MDYPYWPRPAGAPEPPHQHLNFAPPPVPWQQGQPLSPFHPPPLPSFQPPNSVANMPFNMVPTYTTGTVMPVHFSQSMQSMPHSMCDVSVAPPTYNLMPAGQMHGLNIPPPHSAIPGSGQPNMNTLPGIPQSLGQNSSILFPPGVASITSPARPNPDSGINTPRLDPTQLPQPVHLQHFTIQKTTMTINKTYKETVVKSETRPQQIPDFIVCTIGTDQFKNNNNLHPNTANNNNLHLNTTNTMLELSPAPSPRSDSSDAISQDSNTQLPCSANSLSNSNSSQALHTNTTVKPSRGRLLANTVKPAKQNSESPLFLPSSPLEKNEDEEAAKKIIVKKCADLFRAHGPMEPTDQKVLTMFIQLSKEERKLVMDQGSIKAFLCTHRQFGVKENKIYLVQEEDLADDSSIKEDEKDLFAMKAYRAGIVVQDARSKERQPGDGQSEPTSGMDSRLNHDEGVESDEENGVDLLSLEEKARRTQVERSLASYLEVKDQRSLYQARHRVHEAIQLFFEDPSNSSQDLLNIKNKVATESVGETQRLEELTDLINLFISKLNITDEDDYDDDAAKAADVEDVSVKENLDSSKENPNTSKLNVYCSEFVPRNYSVPSSPDLCGLHSPDSESPLERSEETSDLAYEDQCVQVHPETQDCWTSTVGLTTSRDVGTTVTVETREFLQQTEGDMELDDMQYEEAVFRAMMAEEKVLHLQKDICIMMAEKLIQELEACMDYEPSNSPSKSHKNRVQQLKTHVTHIRQEVSRIEAVFDSNLSAIRDGMFLSGLPPLKLGPMPVCPMPTRLVVGNTDDPQSVDTTDSKASHEVKMKRKKTESTTENQEKAEVQEQQSLSEKETDLASIIENVSSEVASTHEPSVSSHEMPTGVDNSENVPQPNVPGYTLQATEPTVIPPTTVTHSSDSSAPLGHASVIPSAPVTHTFDLSSPVSHPSVFPSTPGTHSFDSSSPMSHPSAFPSAPVTHSFDSSSPMSHPSAFPSAPVTHSFDSSIPVSHPSAFPSAPVTHSFDSSSPVSHPSVFSSAPVTQSFDPSAAQNFMLMMMQHMKNSAIGNLFGQALPAYNNVMPFGQMSAATGVIPQEGVPLLGGFNAPNATFGAMSEPLTMTSSNPPGLPNSTGFTKQISVESTSSHRSSFSDDPLLCVTPPPPGLSAPSAQPKGVQEPLISKPRGRGRGRGLFGASKPLPVPGARNEDTKSQTSSVFHFGDSKFDSNFKFTGDVDTVSVANSTKSAKKKRVPMAPRVSQLSESKEIASSPREMAIGVAVSSTGMSQEVASTSIQSGRPVAPAHHEAFARDSDAPGIPHSPQGAAQVSAAQLHMSSKRKLEPDWSDDVIMPAGQPPNDYTGNPTVQQPIDHTGNSAMSTEQQPIGYTENSTMQQCGYSEPAIPVHQHVKADTANSQLPIGQQTLGEDWDDEPDYYASWKLSTFSPTVIQDKDVFAIPEPRPKPQKQTNAKPNKLTSQVPYMSNVMESVPQKPAASKPKNWQKPKKLTSSLTQSKSDPKQAIHAKSALVEADQSQSVTPPMKRAAVKDAKPKTSVSATEVAGSTRSSKSSSSSESALMSSESAFISSGAKSKSKENISGLDDFDDSSSETGQWQQVSKTVKKRKTSTTKPGSAEAGDGDSQKTSSSQETFEKLITKLLATHAYLTRNDVIDVISEVRTKQGGLNGLKLTQIIAAANAVIKDRHYDQAASLKKVLMSNEFDHTELLKKSQMCQFWLAGSCVRTAAECVYAHGRHELRDPPKYILCYNYEKGNCIHGEKCFFAHGRDQLTTPPAELKLKRLKSRSNSESQRVTLCTTPPPVAEPNNPVANDFFPPWASHEPPVEDYEHGETCVICCCGMKPGSEEKLGCGHVFHQACIKRWVVGQERTCPTCRRYVLLDEEFPQLGAA